MDLNKVYCMDCLDGLKMLPDDFCDIVVTSPPYNMGDNVAFGETYDQYKDDLSGGQYYNFIKKVITQLLRVTNHYVFFNFQLLTDNKFSYLRIMSDFKFQIKEIFIWAKPNPNRAGYVDGIFACGYEYIVCFSKHDSKKRTFDRYFFPRGLSNCLIKNTNKEHKEGHHAIFPEWLPEFFIKNFTKEGDVVLDPFSGVGTTAFVAKRMNRKYICFEISQNYCDMTEKRLSQKSLFDLMGE